MTGCDVLIIGAGAAGLTMANTIWEKAPYLKVILVERNDYLGGILRQCLHYGFGMGYFHEEMSGPEYADRLARRLADTNVEIMLNTEVVQINDTHVWLAGAGGWHKLQFRKLILTTGCRERSIGSMGIWGTRPKGVYGAGQLQKMINLGNHTPKDNAVILGGGDMGLILARRLILCGKTVKCIVEIQPQSPAMPRNRRQILERYEIPLRVNTTVTELHGNDWICGVSIHNFQTGEDEYIKCDMLVVAAGLIPERSLLDELNKKEKPQWLYLYGNCEHIHSIADSISLEADCRSTEILKDIVLF